MEVGGFGVDVGEAGLEIVGPGDVLYVNLTPTKGRVHRFDI